MEGGGGDPRIPARPSLGSLRLSDFFGPDTAQIGFRVWGLMV